MLTRRTSDALGVDPADAGLGLHVDVVDEGRAVGVLDRRRRPAGSPRRHRRCEGASGGGGCRPRGPPARPGRAPPAGRRRPAAPRTRRARARPPGRPISGVSAAMATTGSPWKRTRSSASTGWNASTRPRRRLGHPARQLHAHRVPRHVGVREDGDHAGQRRAAAAVSMRDDARRGVRAPDDPPVEHARHHEVARVDGAPVHLLPRVRPRQRVADHGVPRARRSAHTRRLLWMLTTLRYFRALLPGNTCLAGWTVIPSVLCGPVSHGAQSFGCARSPRRTTGAVTERRRDHLKVGRDPEPWVTARL